MGIFSSKKNELESAMEEGLRNAYRYASDNECISEAFDALGAFSTLRNVRMRPQMMSTAASCVGGIRDAETRKGFMAILEHCTKVPQNECIVLTAEELNFLNRFKNL